METNKIPVYIGDIYIGYYKIDPDWYYNIKEKKKRYNMKCIHGGETEIVTKKESYEVRGEIIEVNAKLRVCKTCGQDIFDPELDDITLKEAYRKRAELDNGNK